MTKELQRPEKKEISDCNPDYWADLSYNQAIEDYEAFLAQESKWISVEDRFPEEHQDVLVYYYGNKDSIHFPECRYMTGTSFYNGVFELEKEITHWMPLPDKPQVSQATMEELIIADGEGELGQDVSQDVSELVWEEEFKKEYMDYLADGAIYLSIRNFIRKLLAKHKGEL